MQYFELVRLMSLPEVESEVVMVVLHFEGRDMAVDYLKWLLDYCYYCYCCYFVDMDMIQCKKLIAAVVFVVGFEDCLSDKSYCINKVLVD